MKYIPKGASRFIGRQNLKIRTNSPTILLGAGIAGVIGTTVLASRATLKAQPVMEATHIELETVAYNADKAGHESGFRPDEATLRKARVQIYTKTALQMTKLYGPTVLLGGISIGCLVGSHKILSDRYSNLAAAYVSMQEGLAAYRKRVAEKYGETEEKELFYDVQDSFVIENTPNGPKKVKTKVPGDGGGTTYAKLFNESNPNWKDTPEYNIMFLRQVETHLNTRLSTEGHMFLNRVYEELGMEHTEAGAVAGWLYERGTGDNVIDFGIWDDDRKTHLWDFMVGNEGEIMLDFNVDGPIHKKLNLPKIHRELPRSRR